MFVILLACLACNIMLAAAADNPSQYAQPEFDREKFAGKWYALYQPPAIYKLYHHAVYDFKGAPGHEFSQSVVPEGSEQSVTYEGTSKPIMYGFYEVNLPKNEQFNGYYAVVATDYNNYAVVRGYPQGGDIKEYVSIQFRDEHPSEEHVNRAQEALRAAHLNPNELERDKYY